MSESQLHGITVSVLWCVVVDAPVCGFCCHVDLQPKPHCGLAPCTDVHEADTEEDKYRSVVSAASPKNSKTSWHQIVTLTRYYLRFLHLQNVFFLQESNLVYFL